jgi:hypothetical protein
MKIGHYLIIFLVALCVLFGYFTLKARASVKPVYDVLSIDQRIGELRTQKFALCDEISTIPVEVFDQIVSSCGSRVLSPNQE